MIITLGIIPAPILPMFVARARGDPAIYRRMAEDYRTARNLHPLLNHSRLAMTVGAKVLNIPVDNLLAERKDRQLIETRQRLMAFSRVVSLSDSVPNSWKGIGRAFRRHHATVIYSYKKFGDEVADALRG